MWGGLNAHIAEVWAKKRACRSYCWEEKKISKCISYERKSFGSWGHRTFLYKNDKVCRQDAIEYRYKQGNIHGRGAL